MPPPASAGGGLQDEGPSPFALLPRARHPASTAALRGLSRRGSRLEPPHGAADPWAPEWFGQLAGASPVRAEAGTPGPEAPQRCAARKARGGRSGRPCFPLTFSCRDLKKRARLAGEGESNSLCPEWSVGILHRLRSASFLDPAARVESRRQAYFGWVGGSVLLRMCKPLKKFLTSFRYIKSQAKISCSLITQKNNSML